MLPTTVRHWLFDVLSVQTMRYVSAVPPRKARGLTRDVYAMIEEDFFRNGSLTSRSKVPELMAAIWIGRPRVDACRRSRRPHNQGRNFRRFCPRSTSAPTARTCSSAWCTPVGTMTRPTTYSRAGTSTRLVRRNAAPPASSGFARWHHRSGADHHPPVPFTPEELPEVIGTLMGMSDINRFSHVVMERLASGHARLASGPLKALLLRLFGSELEVTRRVDARAWPRVGAVCLLRTCPLDMQWAAGNPRVANAVARWAAAVER